MKAGKIVGFKSTNNKPALNQENKKGQAQKKWMEKELRKWCYENNVFLEKEYMFHETRKWRFDFAIAEKKVAIEYEGIFSTKSRHTTKGGFIKDAEKYNAAASDGWKVLRYTAKSYKKMEEDLKKI